MNQQCWLWGQDVRRASGNLLLERGFCRQRADDGSAASSQYTLHLEGGRWISLWGFGVMFGEQDRGTYLNRFEFVPRVVPVADGRWMRADAFRGLDVAGDTSALQELAGWIAEYERWVLEVISVDYRETCLRSWRKRVIPSLELPSAWDELAVGLSKASLELASRKRVTRMREASVALRAGPVHE